MLADCNYVFDGIFSCHDLGQEERVRDTQQLKGMVTALPGYVFHMLQEAPIAGRVMSFKTMKTVLKVLEDTFKCI